MPKANNALISIFLLSILALVAGCNDDSDPTGPSTGETVTIPAFFDFEDGDLTHWVRVDSPTSGVGSMDLTRGNLDGTGSNLLHFQVENDGTSKNDHTGAVCLPSAEWSNYSISYDVRMDTGYYSKTYCWFFMEDETDLWGDGYYVILANYDNSVSLRRIVNGVSETIGSNTVQIGTNTEFHVEIRVVSDKIKVLVDGALKITQSDVTYRRGAFSLGTGNSGVESYDAWFDNVSVFIAGTSDMTFDFENGDLTGWVRKDYPVAGVGQMSITDGDFGGIGEKLLLMSVKNDGTSENDHTEALYADSKDWTGYSASFDVKLGVGAYTKAYYWFYQQSDEGPWADGYYVHLINSGDSVALKKVVSGVV